uniref:hypothetical protein n=1 Tax=Nocardia sp. CNY236 TaxID=1169152 RepID=UPI001E4CF49D
PSKTLVGLLKDHAVTVLYPATTRSDFAGVWSYTTLLDATSQTQLTGWDMRRYCEEGFGVRHR